MSMTRMKSFEDVENVAMYGLQLMPKNQKIRVEYSDNI